MGKAGQCMSRSGKQAELLAPAGNPAAFYGAVKAGADAVYLGSQRYGARAYAENFTEEEIAECIRYGHIMGCRLYLTVNTLMKEEEAAELCRHIRPFYESGLDGVIVQDFGALRLLRQTFPGLALHASTQMSLCSENGARLLKEMGASRIVPARELSLDEIRRIKQAADIEVETFIHGAMCYCYSGQCLFSSILGGRSGNRGRCAQPCRLPYTAEINGRRGREQYILSLRDMCTLKILPELMQAGIDSFKIEGRMKKPEYAAGVTAVYRRYMDRYYEMRERYGDREAAERYAIEKEDERVLTSLYIRSQVQDGYYFKKNGSEMITLENPAYSAGDEALLADIRKKYLTDRKRLPITFHAVFREGKPASLTAESGRASDDRRQVQAGDDKPTEGKGPADTAPYSVTVRGEVVQKASNQPVTEENIRKQIEKLGDTFFFAEEILVDKDTPIFYPLKQINELRRQAVSRLEEVLLERSGEPAGSAKRKEAEKAAGWVASAGDAPTALPEAGGSGRTLPAAERIPGRGIAVSLSTGAQLAGLLRRLEEHSDRPPVCVYLAGNLAKECPEECRQLAVYCPLLITLPYILRAADQPWLEDLYALCGPGALFSGFLIRSADGLGFFRNRAKNGLWHLDASVYTWNRAAAEELGEGIDSFCLPYELKAAEQRRLWESGYPFEKPVYGRIPMMITANCILRTAGQCRPGSGDETILIDRFGKRFPVVRDCARCTNIIYNSVPLSLHREAGQWRDRVRLRLDFTVEDSAETGAVLDTFFSGRPPQYEEYTTGHEKRGVL